MKIPKEVIKVIESLQGAGFKTYLVGDGVRAAITEKYSDKWEIVTKAKNSDIIRLVLNGQIIKSDELNLLTVVRVSADKRSQNDINIHIKYLADNIDEYLQGSDFTVEAVAYDLAEDVLIDPFDGSFDIEDEIVKMIGNPKERISKKPIVIMNAIKLVADTNFYMHKETFDAIKSAAAKMQEISKESRREEFYHIINAMYAGKGLRMIMNAGIMQFIVGPKLFKNMKKNEKSALAEYVKNVDRAQKNLDMRLIVFYFCFFKKRYQKAVEYLGCDDKFKSKIEFANAHLGDMYYIKRKADLKRFLVRYGLEKYQLVDAISKEQCNIFDARKAYAVRRYRIMTEIKENNEAVYIGDLAISAEDLIKEGITDDPKRAEQLLELVLDVVHDRPRYNSEELLKHEAREFEKNMFKRVKRSFQRRLKYRN